jgi:hypothetical protein
MLFAQAKDGFPQMMLGNLWKKWADSNPGEKNKLLSYRAGTGPRPSLVTPTGKGFVFFVDAYKLVPTHEPNALFKKDCVYVQNLSSWDGTRRDAAWAQGFRSVALLADGAADPAAYATLAELALIRNNLVNQGWTILGWAPNYTDPEEGVARAMNIVQTHQLAGWIVNGESWWENENIPYANRFIAEWFTYGSRPPLALSCLSSMTPNFGRNFNFAPWVEHNISIQPQVYGNAHPAYTVFNGIETMKKSGVPVSLLNLTFGVYNAGNPIPFADYNTWKGPRSIYLGETLDASQYANLAR